MELTESTRLAGPNVYAQRPVLRFVLTGAPGPAGVLDPAPLFEALSDLRGHWEACLASQDRGENPGVLGHLFEHVCIELLGRADCQAWCVRNANSGRIGSREALIACEEPGGIGLDAARLAVELFEHIQPGSEGGTGDDDPPFNLDESLAAFVRSAQRAMLPVQDREIIRTARRLDIPVFRLVGRILQLGHGRHQQRLSATKTTHTNVVGNDIASNKDYSRRLLGEVGLPVPRFERVYRGRHAVEAARRIGYPVVVKPNNGSMGEGVTVGVKNRREVREAYRRAREHDRSILVEEFVEGNDYRMLVIDGGLVAAAWRVPGHVDGDGVHTVEQLVETVNSDPRRGTGPQQSWTRIEVDDQAKRLLAELGYDLQSIPEAGETVYLRRNANTSDGGTAVDVTDSVHPDNAEIAERAAKVIGLDIAGVDLLTRDISQSLWTHGGTICEVNSRPGIRKHMWPADGQPRDVATPIIRMLFPEGRPSRIPIAVVTGNGDTGTAARTLAHILAVNGHRIGLYAGRCVHVAGVRTASDALSAGEGARAILLDPDIDAAVLEIEPSEVLEHGLPCDALDVCLIVGPGGGSAGKLSKESAESASDAIGVITRAARRAVLLADDDSRARTLDLDGLDVPVSRLHSAPMAADTHRSTDGIGRRFELDGHSLCEFDGDALQTRVDVHALIGHAGSVGPDAERAALLACAAALRLGEAPDTIQRRLTILAGLSG